MTIVDFLSGMICIAVTLYCIIRFFNGLFGNESYKLQFSNFELGYIDLDNKVSKLESNTNCLVMPTKEINELKLQIKNLQDKIEKQNKSTNNKLFDDCVSALMALGTKKKTAKEEVDKYFINHQVNTVEEFVNNFFKDRHDKSSRPN